jgi:fluoride ion exporter CrcB/FEX
MGMNLEHQSNDESIHVPDDFENINEVAAPALDRREYRHSLDNDQGHGGEAEKHSGSKDGEDEWAEEAQDDGFDGLDELEAPPPDENPDEQEFYRRGSLEAARTVSRRRSQQLAHARQPPTWNERLVQLYTYSWLIWFSIMGTLARLGVQWLTYYPNAPATTNELWANVGGCFVMGFLMEDRALFGIVQRRAPATPTRLKVESDSSDVEKDEKELAQLQDKLEKKKVRTEHLAHKKTLPLYIGLSVGFCGSFTSFSSFMRDAFLALSNDLVAKNAGSTARSNGWSVCAVLAVFILEIGLSLIALSAGAHFCEAMMPLLSRVPHVNSTRFLNPLGVVLGFGCWLGAVFLAIWPPHNKWRSDCVFALVFAPLGCILRFLLAIKLNSRIISFPLGTFVANVLGTAVLAMAYDLQHASLGSAGGLVGGGIVGCQVLQGVMDGFCGCLTTVSTWVAELKGLVKRHAYVYGAASVAVGFALMVVITGTLQWTIGLSQPVCL